MMRDFSGFNFDEREIVLLLDYEMSLSFWLHFVPDSIREFDGTLLFTVFDSQTNELIEEATVEISGNGVPPEEVKNMIHPVASGFEIGAAFPNPFNSTTTLSCSMSVSAEALIEVYDVNGQSLKTLYNGVQSAGDHSLLWVAGDVSSGVYFVRMESNGFSATRKVVLMK
jgi:hypothetical protein